MTDNSSFAPWYVEGEPIPVMHPMPWVYAEVYFPAGDVIEWRVYDYVTDDLTIETFELEDVESDPIPGAYSPTVDPLIDFIGAVKEDEHAEYDLGGGYTLVTDWEGDGTFNPHVVPPDGDDGTNEQRVDDLLTVLEPFRVEHVEYSEANGVYYPSMSLRE